MISLLIHTYYLVMISFLIHTYYLVMISLLMHSHYLVMISLFMHSHYLVIFSSHTHTLARYVPFSNIETVLGECLGVVKSVFLFAVVSYIFNIRCFNCVLLPD